MAVTKCENCGKMISKTAKFCPYCHIDFKKDSWPLFGKISIGFFILMVVISFSYIGIGFFFEEPKEDVSKIKTPKVVKNDIKPEKRREPKVERDWRKIEDSGYAYVMAKHFVEKRLKSPKSADFPWSSRDHVTYLGNQQYRVTAYVDAKNAFGAEIRTDFTCIVEQIDDGKWSLNEIQFKSR